MKKWLVVTMLQMSQEVDNVYVIEAETEQEAHRIAVDCGYISIVKEIRDDNLPIIAFITIDTPKILRKKGQSND